MKTAYIFSFMLFASTGLHAMEQEKNEWPDLKKSHDTLKANIKKSVIKYLDEVNRHDLNINKLLEKSEWSTGLTTAAEEAIKEYRDEMDNTVTHILVTCKLADSLYTCAVNDLLSFTKNKLGHTPFDIALGQFSEDVDKMLEENDSDYPMSTKCCLFILSKHINNTNTSSVYNHFSRCCDKH